MAYEFRLPDIGEGVVEGEIVEWLVKEGDTVVEDQPLVAVMTDKATVEIPSPKAGRISKLGGPAGQIVKVGAMLVTIETPGGASAAPAAPAAAAVPKVEAAPAPKVEAPKAAPPAPVVVAPASPVAVAAAPPRPAPIMAAPAAARSVSAEGSESVLASPATRKLAREMGIDLGDVRGSGPRGRITREDVEMAASAGAKSVGPARAATSASASASALSETPAPAAAAPRPAASLLAIPHRASAAGEQVEDRVPLRGLRKKIAERMQYSKNTAAHFAYVDEFDCTELVNLRKRLKPLAERYGVNVTYIPIIMKALVPCLREFPLLNSSLDETTSELVLKHYYNIGFAVDTDRGLTVPVIRDVENKSILEIAAEMAELAERARAGRSKMEDIQGGTFTITSTGNIGGLFATPIINHPEVAILGVPKMRRAPWVVNEQIVIRDILCLAISLDHRVVDGAVGARFMNRLIEYLAEPSRLVLEMA